MKNAVKNFVKKVGAYMTRPLSEKEKKLMQELNEIVDIFTWGPKKTGECKHEFIVEDYSKQLLKCKKCSYKITAIDLGKEFKNKLKKKELKKKEETDLNINDLLKL